MTTEATLGKDTIRQSKLRHDHRRRSWCRCSCSTTTALPASWRCWAWGLNMLMLVALMILIKAPFTLPALAGLALTVGMDGGQQRADLRAIKGRNRPRGGLADGDPQRLPPRGRGDHRRQHHAPDRGHGPLERGHGADQGFCRHLLAGGRVEHLGHDVRCPRDVRGLRAPPLGPASST